jgi:hypothetical protein
MKSTSRKAIMLIYVSSELFMNMCIYKLLDKVFGLQFRIAQL